LRIPATQIAIMVLNDSLHAIREAYPHVDLAFPRIRFTN
jgi:hypothetical protein